MTSLMTSLYRARPYCNTDLRKPVERATVMSGLKSEFEGDLKLAFNLAPSKLRLHCTKPTSVDDGWLLQGGTQRRD